MRRLKTSDRLLAAMVIGSVVLVCCIQLALYAQFRRGHIVTWKQLQQRRFVQFHPRKPAVVSLTGTVWVNIFPSDSFYVELPKTQSPVEKPWMTGQTGPEESIPMPGFTETADTLLVTGGFAATLHRPYVDLSYRNHIPVVNIYGSGFDEIRLLNGQLVLNGSPTTAGAPAFHLTAINSTIWVADNTDPAPTTLPDAFFDSLDLRLSNSFLVFNHPATIRAACIDLDGNSELNDRWSTAGQLKIIATDSSHIGLTGNNWKKATFHIH